MTTFVTQETRTDIAGSYIAYVYADGHTETDPPGRPLSKEDLQRQRLQQATQSSAKNAVSASRAAASQSALLQRENAATAGGALLWPAYNDYQNKLAQLTTTATTPQTAGGLRDTLLATAYTGTPPGETESVTEDNLTPDVDVRPILTVPQKVGR